MTMTHRATAVCWLIVAAVTAGCPTSAPPSPVRPARGGGDLDACAQRLHNISGALLLHYAAHRTLPPDADALAASDTVPLPPLVCPASNRPYHYDPAGLTIPGLTGRLVLYDAEASHDGMRWGILVGPPAGGMIATKVIPVSEATVTRAEARR